MGKRICLATKEDDIKYIENLTVLEHTVFLDTVLFLLMQDLL